MIAISGFSICLCEYDIDTISSGKTYSFNTDMSVSPGDIVVVETRDTFALATVRKVLLNSTDPKLKWVASKLNLKRLQEAKDKQKIHLDPDGDVPF